MSQNCIKELAHRFFRNSDGSVGLLFSLTTLPLILFAGAAIDYSNASQVRAKLQSAADSVALALVKEPRGMAAAQLQAIAERQFSALMRTETGTDASISVSVAGKTIQVSARIAMPTSFLKIVHQDKVSIGVNAVAAYGQPKLQIALVLDNTGSMGQMGKMAALKQATNDLLDKLSTLNAAPGDVKVSLVPFNTQVRVATSYSSASWLRWGVSNRGKFPGASIRLQVGA